MIDGKIIIPTSGGYDSRLLNFLVRDRKRIDSFTYGITNFSDLPSCEVAKAQRLSQLLGTSWKEIKLGNFHKYCREWFRLFGCSTHLHGMYQVEFYKKVAGEIKTKASLLSGIFGDVWNGKVEMEPINKHGDLPTLGYSHNISLRGDSARFKTDHAARLKYFSEHKDQLNTAYLNPILTVRLKLILISYLMSIPDYFGIPSWTPFLNYKIVKSILSLNEACRKKRSWQTKFYQKSGVWLESMGIKCTDLNTLNLEGNLSFPISPLDQETLKTLIKKKCLKRVQANYTLLNKYPNRDISKLPWPFNRAYKNKMDPYSHMLILKSLELTLKFLETKHY